MMEYVPQFKDMRQRPWSGLVLEQKTMAKFIAKNMSVNNSDLNELDGFVPKKGISVTSWIIGGNTYERSSSYADGKLIVKWSANGLKYKVTTEVAAKKLKSVFQGDDWEPKFFKGDDKIQGSSQADVLYGFEGGDTIHGEPVTTPFTAARARTRSMAATEAIRSSAGRARTSSTAMPASTP
jgi:hypothetical protein